MLAVPNVAFNHLLPGGYGFILLEEDTAGAIHSLRFSQDSPANRRTAALLPPSRLPTLALTLTVPSKNGVVQGEL